MPSAAGLRSPPACARRRRRRGREGEHAPCPLRASTRSTPIARAATRSATMSRSCSAGSGRGPKRSASSARRSASSSSPARTGQPLVERQSLIDLRDILLGQESLRPRHVMTGSTTTPARIALQFSAQLRREACVKIVAHRRDVAVLLGPQQVARPPDLQIAQRQLEPRAQLGQLLHRPEPALGLLVHPPVGRDQQVGVGLQSLPPHPPAELVELGQAEPVGPVDDDGVRGRDVEPRLHDGGRDQDVGLAATNRTIVGFQLALVHLAVPHDHARVRAPAPG